MNAGELDEKLTIQEGSDSENSGGQQTRTLADIGTDPTFWAKVVVDSASEGIDGQQMEATRTYSFMTRRRTDLTAQMVVEWTTNSDLLLRITGITLDYDRKRRWMLIEAVEEAA